MMHWLKGTLDRIFAVIGALVISQAPLFIQDYQKQLIGHVAELQQQVNVMQNAAQMSGKTLSEYVGKFLSSGDQDFTHQGEIMNHLIARWEYLSESSRGLSQSSIFMKPFVFITHLDLGIMKSTYHSFSFGLSLNIEGVIYAFFGMLLGYLTFHGLQGLCRGVIKNFRREQTHEVKYK